MRCVCQLLSVMDFKCDDSDHTCSVTELRVIDVLPESEAARKGVKVGDVVVAVDMKAAQVQPRLPFGGCALAGPGHLSSMHLSQNCRL